MDIHISEFVSGRTQGQVAAILGVTQGSVWKMLKAKRDIYFRPRPDGSYHSYEIKNPTKKKSA